MVSNVSKIDEGNHKRHKVGESAKEAAAEKREARRLSIEAKVKEASVSYKELKKSLASGSKDNACVDMYSILLDDVLTLIPQTKAEIEEDTTNTQMGYLFIALVGTARDLASEIRAVSDLEENIHKIMEDIIIPSATRQMQNLLTEVAVLHEDLKTIVPINKRGPIKEKVSKMLERYAGTANDTAHKMIEDIREQLAT